MADIVKYSDQRSDFRCLICGSIYIPNFKMPNVCGSCSRVVKTQRRKAGLREIPKIDKDVREHRKKEKKKYLEWYKEESASDNFGKKIKIKT